jgi:hypothetical protein
MSLSIIGIILSAALLHAIWNSIVKSASDRTTTLGLIAFGHVPPGSVMVAVLPLPSAESFIYIILSTLVQFGYIFILGWAYQHGDLSIVYQLHAALFWPWCRSGPCCFLERFCRVRFCWASV